MLGLIESGNVCFTLRVSNSHERQLVRTCYITLIVNSYKNWFLTGCSYTMSDDSMLVLATKAIVATCVLHGTKHSNTVQSQNKSTLEPRDVFRMSSGILPLPFSSRLSGGRFLHFPAEVLRPWCCNTHRLLSNFI